MTPAPGKPLDWRFVYDPAANGGLGAIQVTLQTNSFTFNLKQGHKAEGARFDRFGLCSVSPGGSMVKIYFDDLSYTGGSNR